MIRGSSFVSFFDFKRRRASETSPILFETEEVFRNRLSMPEEEEQYRLYRSIVGATAGSSLIATLFDWSKELILAQSLLPFELKRFEGTDGFALWKENPTLLISQIRALLRASYDSSVWLLAPKLRRPEELSFLLKLLEEVLSDLSRGRGPFDRYPKLGVRLDSPIALTQVESFSRADFFVVDLDRLVFHFFGLHNYPESLLSLFPLQEHELKALKEKMQLLLFQKQWLAIVSRFPQEVWGELTQFPIEVYFERLSGEARGI